jgi:hypothetical protein
MIKSQKRDELLKAIVYIKSKKTIKYRKVTIEDLINIPKKKKYDEKNMSKNERINSFRKQEEFGPKKRIKP